MINVYENCPKYENEKYCIRLISAEDCDDLLKVYSDEKIIPLFNCDNCPGANFRCTQKDHMAEAIRLWLVEYNECHFVRWTIVDKTKNIAIGTIELYKRDADDYFSNCGILRLDIRSDYEKSKEIESLLSLIIEPTFELFQCQKVATKAISEATERITALKALGFTASTEKLIGNDGTEYDSYFVRCL